MLTIRDSCVPLAIWYTRQYYYMKQWIVYDILQWNLSVTTTSKIKCITFDLLSNVF